MRVLFAVLVSTLLLAVNCQATDFSIVLNDDSVQGVLGIAFNENEVGESLFEGRILYDDDRDSLLGSAAVGVRGTPGNVPGLQLGAKVIGNVGRLDKLDVVTIGLGLDASYQPPQLQGFGAHGRFQYSPQLLSFSDSEGFRELAFGCFYSFTPRASLLVEYQNTEADFDTYGDRRLDDSIRAGLLFHF